MLPVEWPIAAPGVADESVERARVAGRDRLPVVRRDLFLDNEARLTEQERALMSAMLIGLVEQVADEIRLGLPHDYLAQAEQDRENLVPRLWRSGALDRPALVRLLLRRADEQSVRAARRDARGAGDLGLVERLVADADPAVASAAMALAVARGRRRDRFGRQGLEFDDLPAEEASALVHCVAAAVRAQMAPSVAVDEACAKAASHLIERHDHQRQVDTRTFALAEALNVARGPDDEVVAILAVEGDSAMLAAVCAVRAGIAPESAWLLLINDGPCGAMLLARMAGLA